MSNGETPESPTAKQCVIMVILALVAFVVWCYYMGNMAYYERNYSDEVQFTSLEALEEFVVAVDEQGFMITNLSKQSPLTVSFRGYADLREMTDWTYSEAKKSVGDIAIAVIFTPLIGICLVLFLMLIMTAFIVGLEATVNRLTPSTSKRR